MAFSYQLASSDSAVVLRSKVRFELGDTEFQAGVLPDGDNFSDAEIDLYLAQNGNDVEEATTALMLVLSRRWSNLADVQVGPRRESLSQIAKAWQARATEMTSGQSFVTGMVRATLT